MRWLPLLALVSCFEPTYPEGLLCSSANTCPPGQMCNLATMHCAPGGGVLLPDSAVGDTPDAAPTQTQLVMHLGDPCTVTADGSECDEFGLLCATRLNESVGFCTYACAFPVRSCTAGYTRPGTPVCEVTSLRSTEICNLRCGADHDLPETCPAGLVCRDLAFTPDGKNDTCTSPLPVTSLHLGASCTVAQSGDPSACDQFGLTCLKFVPDGPGQMEGMCTRPCTMPDQLDVCDDQYGGLGKPMCVIPPGIATPHCGILCGTEPGLPQACPGNLVCRDTNMNSQTDACIPPMQL